MRSRNDRIRWVYRLSLCIQLIIVLVSVNQNDKVELWPRMASKGPSCLLSLLKIQTKSANGPQAFIEQTIPCGIFSVNFFFTNIEF